MAGLTAGPARTDVESPVGRTALVEAAFEAIDHGVGVLDADLNVVVCNRRFLELLDCPPSGLGVGDPWEAFIRRVAQVEVIAGEGGDNVQSMLARARRAEPHWMEWSRADGTVIELRCRPLDGGGLLAICSDISDRRRDEQEAREREQRLVLAVESISAGFSVFDAADRLVLCNSHYKDHYPGIADLIRPGVTFEEIVRTASKRDIVADAAENGEHWVDARLAQHRAPAGPIVQRQSDGRWIQIDEKKAEDGATVAVFTDVTNLKRREEALNQAIREKDAVLAEFNAVMDTIEYGVLFLGPDLCARITNHAFGKFFEFPAELLARRANIREFLESSHERGFYRITDAEFPAYADQRIAAIAAGDIAPVDLSLADGRVFQFQCKSLPDGGRMLTYFDITEHKRTEAALRDSEQRFRDFAAASSDWFWEMGPDLRFSFISEPMETWTQVPPSQVLGRTREELGRGSLDEKAWRRHLDDINAHRPFKNFRYPVKRIDGSEMWMSTSGVPVFAPDGSFRGYRGSASNINAEVQRERELREARDQAERALFDLKKTQTSLVHAEKLALLGQLVAGIAHEIKNPLNFVNNFSALCIDLLDDLRGLLGDALAGLDADVRADAEEVLMTLGGNLRKIGEHGARADGIVRSMLAHSREGPGERRAADINAVVEESLNLAYHGARASDPSFNVTLERDYGADAGAVEIIPQDVSRVLLNIFTNGFHATHERLKRDGDAAYRPTLRVSTRRADGAVDIRVRDNGTGIPPAVADKIFTPFFTTKPAGEGTGLGLSLSYDIVVHQHKGRLEVETSPGEFTEFTVRLPADTGTACE